MKTLLLAVAEQVTADPQQGDAFSQGLEVSGIALFGIFIIMGLFAAMITLLTSVFPDGEGE